MQCNSRTNESLNCSFFLSFHRTWKVRRGGHGKFTPRPFGEENADFKTLQED